MMAYDIETATKVIRSRNSSKAAETGGFVLWQMKPDMWYVELALGGSKVHAGCNGRLVWRHTPWLGAHAAKGPVRPLRRALQVNITVHWCLIMKFIEVKVKAALTYCTLCFNDSTLREQFLVVA